MWHSRPPRDPPAFMANAILNFHFDYLHTSLNWTTYALTNSPLFEAKMTQNDKKNKGAATGRGGHGRLGDEGELKGRRLRTGSQVLRCRLYRVFFLVAVFTG